MTFIDSDKIAVFPVLNRDPAYYDSSRNLSGNNLQKWADASSKVIKCWSDSTKDYLFVEGLYIELPKGTTNSYTYVYVMSNLDGATELDVDSKFKGIGFPSTNNPDTETYTGYTKYSIDDLKNPISEIICDKF